MKGWAEGLEKVSLSKLQMEILQIPLARSKKNVDELLDGESIIIEGVDDVTANKFILMARDIGVLCDFIED